MRTITFFFLLTLWSCKKDPVTQVVQPDPTSLRALNPAIRIGSNLQHGGTNEDGVLAGANQAKLAQIAQQEYGIGQVLWFGNWGGWEQGNNFNFKQSNAVINWLKSKGMQAFGTYWFGNNLYWPQWFVDKTYSPAQMEDLMHTVIDAQILVNDNKSKVDYWHVVNEVFENDGVYRNMKWNDMGWEEDASGLTGIDNVNGQHPIFIRKAFEYLRTKTNAPLEIRDFAIENQNPAYGWDKKHRAFFQLVKHLKNKNTPVDIVGIQGHLNIGNIGWMLLDNGVKNTVSKFKSLQVAVIVCELDCSINQYSNPTEWSAAAAVQQKQDIYNYVKQAIEGGATQIHTWGIRDENDKGWLTFGHPLLWDKNYQKKPAYDGLKQALMDTK